MFHSYLAALDAYKPPLSGRDPQKHLLLDFNERTLGVSDAVKQALIDYIQSDTLQKYTDYGDFLEHLAQYCAVGANQLMITNGSDQGIDLIVRASACAGGEVILPVPSFPIYRQCAAVEGLTPICVDYHREKGFPLEAALAAITPRTNLIILGNPNNPTGTHLPKEAVIALAKAAPHVPILVDECYFEYTQHTLCQQIMDYPNIIVARTFSKTWGLASLRLGYVIAHPDAIETLLKIRGPYDVNQMAVVAAGAALAEPDYMHRYIEEVMQRAKPQFEAFLKARNIPFWPSVANFIWMFPPQPEALLKVLTEQGILVRPRVDNDQRMGLRVTIGTCEQMQRFMQVMASVCDA